MLNSLFAMLPFSILNENVLHSVIYSSKGKSVPLTSLLHSALRFLHMADHFCNPGTVTQTGDGFSSRVDNHVDKCCRMCLWHRIFLFFFFLGFFIGRLFIVRYYTAFVGFPGSTSEEPTCPCKRQMWVWSLGQEGPLQEGTATHSSVPAWRTPWTE